MLKDLSPQVFLISEFSRNWRSMSIILVYHTRVVIFENSKIFQALLNLRLEGKIKGRMCEHTSALLFIPITSQKF